MKEWRKTGAMEKLCYLIFTVKESWTLRVKYLNDVCKVFWGLNVLEIGVMNSKENLVH